MNDSTLSITMLADKLRKKHNVIKLRTSAMEIKNIPDDFDVDLFIINFGNISKADILYICDHLSSRPYDHTPIIYLGSYFAHSIFSSKINKLIRTAIYISSGNIEDLQNNIVRELDLLPPKVSSEPVTTSKDSSGDASSDDFTKDSSSSTDLDSSANRKRILIIDDDSLLLSTVARYLADDFNVSAVDSTARAFMDIGFHKPDLILLDYMMPLCDGKQTLTMLKNQYETKNIPVIMLTAHTEKERVLECHGLGAAGYLVKPVNRNDLIRTIMNIL